MICNKATKANFNDGIIPNDHLNKIKEMLTDTTIGLINSKFQISIPSRYPIKVARIVKNKNRDLHVEFYNEKLKDAYKRAGTRPILSIAIFGRYQSGKTTTAAGITGNLGHEEGDGIEEKTDGVYLDGPYELQYLYERFDLLPNEELFFNGNENLTPVIYIFDIEGYAGKQHGIISDLNNEAYIKLCTPFFCLSSVFVLIADKNPDIEEIGKMVDAMKISNLTIHSNLEGNGALPLIVGLRNFTLFNKNEVPTFDLVQKKIQLMQKNKLKNWYGNERFESKGIKTKSVPMISPINPDGFIPTFKYLAQEVIHSVEIAAQGNYMRGCDESLSLFNYIIQNYDKETFENDIKNKIAREHENTLGTIAYRAMNNSIEELKPIIESYFKSKVNEDTKVDDILNYFEPKAIDIIHSKIGTVRDSFEVIKYIEQFKIVISYIIRRRFDDYKHECEKKLIEKKEAEQNQFFDEQMNQESSKKLENQKLIIKNLLISKIKFKLSKQFIEIKDDEIKNLSLKLLKKEYYLKTYSNNSVIAEEICNKIEENLNNSIKEYVEESLIDINEEQPEFFDLANEIYKEKSDEIENIKFIKDIINKEKMKVNIAVVNSYKEARANLAQVKHEFEKQEQSFKLNIYEKIIYTFPDGTQEETDWQFVRTEWKHFDDILNQVRKIFSFIFESVTNIFNIIKLISA